MNCISFISQKGGCGKTTLVSSIAVAAHEAGRTVALIDLDPLAPLLKWQKIRNSADIRVVALASDYLEQVLAKFKSEGVDLVLIDTPGTAAPLIDRAARLSDFCVIPARPNIFDLWAAEATRKTLKNLGKDCAFLLNQCPPAQQSTRVKLAAKTIEEMGGLVGPLVSSRVDYQEAARLGLGVSQLNKHGTAAAEMRALWSSLEQKLTPEQQSVTHKNEAESPFDAALRPSASALIFNPWSWFSDMQQAVARGMKGA